MSTGIQNLDDILLFLLTPDPPVQPTMLNSSLISPCAVDIEWALGATPPRTAKTSFLIVEVSHDGLSGWTPIGRANVTTQTFLRGRIPPNGLNTIYFLRARSGNDSVGTGDNYQEPTPFTAYTEGG